MKTRNWKRLLSLLLCLCLAAGLLPATALAADQPAITTETLEAATVGEKYTAALEAEPSDQNGELAWTATGLPEWLAIINNGDGTAALDGTPTEAGEVKFTVTVTETIPAAEPGEPAEGTDPADSTVLTASKEYTLTVAEPANEPETDPGISLRSVTSKQELSGFNLYLQPESGGTVGQEDIITQFSIANELFLSVNSYPGTNPTKIALISGNMNVANLDETNLNNNALVLAVGGQNGAMAAVNGRLVVDHFRTVDANGGAPSTDDGITLNDGFEYRFLVWDGAEGGNQTVYYSSETYTYTADNAIPMTVTKDGQSVTQFSNTDTITIRATLPTAPTSVTSVFFVDSEHTTSTTYMYLEDGSVTFSGNTVSITMEGLYEGRVYAPGTKDGLILPGTYNIILYDDSASGEIKYVSSATYTVTGEGGTPTVSTPVINTTSLPGGVTGTAYSQTLQATPGTQGKAVTWSLASGSLPTGLTLNTDGSITGTPTAAGSYTFTVTAQEADGGETSKSLTITIIEAITSSELKVGSGSYGPGDSISVIWNMSAGVPEGGEATLTLHYTNTSSQAKTAPYAMTLSPLGYFYAYVALPEGCASVQKVSAEAKVSGQTVTAENSDLDITMKGKLILNWNDRLERMVTLEIKDEQSGNIFTHYLYSNSTGLEFSLPAGEYTLSATISVIGMGDVPVLASPTGPITISAGEIKEQALTFRATNAVTYQPEVKRSDGGTLYSSGYSLYWYEDADGTKPLGVGYNYTAMADDTLYVQAVPKGNLSATHNETAVTEVTQNMTLSLVAKPTDTVTVTVQCADISGGGTLDKVDGSVVLSQPGEDGTTKTTQQWVYSYSTQQVTFTGVTAGSTITFTPNDQYLCGPASTTINNITGGNSQEITLKAEPLNGVITLNLTVNYEKSTSHPLLSGFYDLKVKNGDTDIPFHRVGNNYLVLDDLNGLSAGTQLTISGQYGSGDFPIAVFATDVTLSGENLSATKEVTMDARGKVRLSTASREIAAADLLLYESGKLFYIEESYINGRSGVGVENTRNIWDHYLPAGSYTAYVVDRDYLSTVDPETYQEESNITFQNGTYTSVSFTVVIKQTEYVYLDGPGIVQSHADVNYEMSSVTGTEEFPGTLTHTTVIALTSNEKLDESRGISLALYHNQYASALPIRSLTINGIPYEGYSSGDSMHNRVELSLNQAALERYGGFPLRISYVLERYDYSKLDFESYLFYTNDAGESRTARVGTFYQESSDVVLNVPSMVNERTFTVSGYVPQRGKNVTVYLDGAAVATVQSGRSLVKEDGSFRYLITGYFAAQVTLPEDVEEFDTFRVSAAWEEGVSEDMQVMYTETTGLLTKVTVYPNSLNGYVIWERGDSVSEGRYYQAYNGQNKLSWEAEFANPDKVTNVVVHVPRSDGSELELTASRVDNSRAFRTETAVFYNASPTGVYVTYDNELIPRANAKTPISAEDFAAGIEALNQSGVISNMTGDQDSLTFTLKNPDGEDIPVTVESKTEAWGTNESAIRAELASFDALKEKPEYSTLPSYILYYDEGYLDIYEDDGQEGGYWGSDRICKYSKADGGTIYQREIYTMGERIVITWDVEAKTTTTHRITLGSGTGSGQPDEKKVTSASEYVQAYQRTAQVEQLWMLFYQQLSDACEKAGTANTLSARTMSLAAPKGGKLNLKGKIDVNKLKERADALAEDSETWAEGQEITAAEIRQIKDFLDDNPGLVDLYKMYQSQGGDNPYKVVGDIRATYYERGMGLIEKALSLATGKPKDVVDAIKDGVKDYAIDTVKGKIFYRQSEGMVCDLYVAARQAERTETGVGGMLPGGINWSRFPTNIYDPNSSFSSGNNRLTLPNTPRGTYDPSGYVYEAVPSNRVVDAEVNLYTFNESARAEEWVEIDMYGISEKNPQITGADGRYEWFVPQGYWRVVVTKDGYEPVDTGDDQSYGTDATNSLDLDGDGTGDYTASQYWMPVLPIQLDVNIPLVSYAAPTVQKVEATTEGVYVTFSKYMQVDLGTNDFLINGMAPASVAPVNAEAASSAEDAPEYASVFKLTYPANMEVSADDTINVYVVNTVTSYAGTEMGMTYTSDSVRVQEQLPPADAPQLAAGMPGTNSTVDKNTVVYLEVPDGASVYYTIDGKDPATSSTRKLYNASSGIIVDRTMTIRAVAVQAGKANSGILELNYNVVQEIPEIPDDPDLPDTPVIPGGSSGGGGGGGSSGYSVSVPASSSIKGGSITVSPRSADKGDTVTITVKPDDGYELSKLTVTDAKGNELELTDKGSGKYTFAMPGSSVKIQVSFKEIAEQVTNPFTDVYESDYYHDAVLWAVANGVTNGTSATTFSPNAPVTRSQMVTFLWRAHGSPKATGSNPFADVSADAYYYDAVLWAVANGVTNGTSATTFSPDAPVTRSQAVTFQWRAAGSPVVAGDSFDDVAADAYYAGAVTWAVANGITNGTGGNKFSPEVTVTRAQAVTFLWRELA